MVNERGGRTLAFSAGNSDSFFAGADFEKDLGVGGEFGSFGFGSDDFRFVGGNAGGLYN